KPLFATLKKHNIIFEAFDLKKATFSDQDLPNATLYFNQASPSGYIRGNTRAIPLALALMENLEQQGATIINGSKAFRFELSKLAQIALMRKLNIDYPKSIAFNDLDAIKERITDSKWPAILKPNQGGSGARMYLLQSFDELEALLTSEPELWLPDNLFILQEYLEPKVEEEGIVRMEFVNGDLLYAMKVISRGSFNLCPSEYCNPQDIAESLPTKDQVVVDEVISPSQSPEFIPYPEVPSEAVKDAKRIFRASGLDIGAIEYMETVDGRRVFYDINANSNLRPSIGEFFGFDPFEKVVDFLNQRINQLQSQANPPIPCF
ncbi:MAG: hypothetical protein IH840_18430, partial [Candidatus Heimdallarchaeota archaeon]|nr:hypothetical protein [Candidatus Heimdallarchaeota archaeon]